MRILSMLIQNLQESRRKGQDVMWDTNIPSKVEVEYDCMSEPFTKPQLSSTLKQSITMETFKHIITDLATQLDRVTTKVFGKSQAYNVVDDLSLEECEVFIVRWSEDLKCLRGKYRSHLGKIFNVERFKRSLEGLNTREDKVQKLTEAHKDFYWFIYILKSLPKSSVCREGCARVELLNLYRLWKKGQLISMLPIMDFIMKTLLKEKDSILKRRLQHRSALMETGSCVPLEFKLHILKDLMMKFSL
ncbi:uncharacterized protein zgc:113314 isoform X1 [Rhinichthys klamathensis goyatoka]|uniref:uncharacterized protein zgc:113314 isoform X1 n=1 Tax=Rhinichthys klamathensis goyatoka TaxID=3034132 RepID=UPI0024B5B3BA|nr:uncharacterized protein zgc:113314 isoform X1 [Rhinichthys klamathensis goyatoka]